MVVAGLAQFRAFAPEYPSPHFYHTAMQGTRKAIPWLSMKAMQRFSGLLKKSEVHGIFKDEPESNPAQRGTKSRPTLPFEQPVGQFFRVGAAPVRNILETPFHVGGRPHEALQLSATNSAIRFSQLTIPARISSISGYDEMKVRVTLLLPSTANPMIFPWRSPSSNKVRAHSRRNVAFSRPPARQARLS